MLAATSRIKAMCVWNFSFYSRFFGFLGVGAIGTATHYLVLFILINLVEAGPVLSSIVGSVLGAFVNYCLNYRFTFRSTKPHKVSGTRYVIMSGISVFMNYVIVATLIGIFDTHVWLAQIFATAMVVLLNYLLASSWVFASA